VSKDILDFNAPAPPAAEEDSETLAAIDRGLLDAGNGRTVSLDEARKLIPEWISRFESRKAR
jgi:predicted transcriptional regulator